MVGIMRSRRKRAARADPFVEDDRPAQPYTLSVETPHEGGRSGSGAA